ncbi:hypothetical protein HN011_005211 [Eciton burchellii]|nr:hypothetical protein HN011_005211 [Eciton burchellii]
MFSLDRLLDNTLRPVLIDSASALVSDNVDAIKTHHNDNELAQVLRTQCQIVELLKLFLKDEVRGLVIDLGLPIALVSCHLFPGPGLAVRILCADKPYIKKNFSEMQVIAKRMAEYEQMLQKKHMLLNRVESATTEHQQRVVSHNNLVNLVLRLLAALHIPLLFITFAFTIDAMSSNRTVVAS